MKISYFTDTYYPTPDGVSTYLKEVKEELERRGIDVSVFSLTGDASEKNVIIPRTVPFPPYDQYRMPVNIFPFSLYRKVLEVKPDIVHIHNTFFMSSIGYLSARRMKVPVIATFHTDFTNMQNSIKMPLKNLIFSIAWKYSIFIYKKADIVLVPSSDAGDLLSKYGVRNIRILPLFIDTEKYTPREKTRKGKILFIGRMTVDKGVYDIISLAEKMKDDPVSFELCGIGPELENIRKIVKNKKLGNVIVDGYVSESEKIEKLRESWIFIYPAKADTFGLSVFESLSCGMPVFVSNKFPVKEDTISITYINFENPETVRKRIMEVYYNEDLYAGMREEARSLAVKKYSVESHIDSLLSIYEQTINGNERSHIAASNRNYLKSRNKS